MPNSPGEAPYNADDYTGIGSGNGASRRGHAINGGSSVNTQSREGSIKGRRREDRDQDEHSYHRRTNQVEDRTELRRQPSATSVGSTSSYSRFDPSTYLDPAYFVNAGAAQPRSYSTQK